MSVEEKIWLVFIFVLALELSVIIGETEDEER